MSASSQEEQDLALAKAELRAAERKLKELRHRLRDAALENPNTFLFTDPCLTIAGAEVDACERRLRWLEQHYCQIHDNPSLNEGAVCLTPLFVQH